MDETYIDAQGKNKYSDNWTKGTQDRSIKTKNILDSRLSYEVLVV